MRFIFLSVPGQKAMVYWMGKSLPPVFQEQRLSLRKKTHSWTSAAFSLHPSPTPPQLHAKKTRQVSNLTSPSEESPWDNLPSSTSSWFCPRISLGGRSFLCHRGFPRRRAASWWGRPSVPGAPRRTRGASTRPCRGTRCTRRRTPACTAGWRRTSAPAAPRGPRCASWAGPAGSSLQQQEKVFFTHFFTVLLPAGLQYLKLPSRHGDVKILRR